MIDSTLIKAIGHELMFWKTFVKSDRFLNGWAAFKRTPELIEPVYQFLLDQQKANPNIKVLDVGSGVISILYGTITGQLYAADPLGALYETVYDYKKNRIVPPMTIFGEEIAFREEFDIVHISNALDHTQEPLKVFYNILKACKKDGYIIIQGFEDEAEHEKWQGFHQWNIKQLANGTLQIYGKKEELITLDKGVHTFTKIKEHFQGRDWFVTIYKKQ